MRHWRLVFAGAAVARALTLTNSHWDVSYTEPFVISWDDNSTTVDLELLASDGNLTGLSGRSAIACALIFFFFYFFSPSSLTNLVPVLLCFISVIPKIMLNVMLLC